MSEACLVQKDFSTHFWGCEVVPRCDAALMRSAQELRYQVYCQECKFLDARQYPDGRESDEHDVDSAHFAALNLQDQLVGYVRLVRPDAIHTFPFQNHCVALFEGVTLPPPDESAEVSRLMVHKNYRRRAGEHGPNGVAQDACTTESTHEMRNPSPQILLTMYRLMYEHSLRSGIRYWYAAMEQSLARLLIRMGFGFTQVGPATDYYGPVAPYVGDLRLLEAQLEQRNPALMAWMRGLSGD